MAVLAAADEPRWPVELTFTMEKNLPLVQVSIGDVHNLTFILDSAAAGCVIDRDRSAEIGLAASEPAMSSGSGGLQPGEVITGIHLNVGGLEIRPERCFTFDMKALKFRGSVAGILGMPLFRKYVVEIDYPSFHVRVFQPEGYRAPSNAEVFQVRITTGPVIRGSIRVHGREPIHADFQLDTGSAHVLTLCTAFVDRLKLVEAAEEVTDGSTLGIGGNAVDKRGRIEEVRIGRFALRNPVVHFSRQTTGTLSSEQYYSANLGGEFLKRYKVTFDLPGSRLFLED